MAAFSDLNISVEQLVANDDNVALAYSITCTHQGDFLGRGNIAPIPHPQLSHAGQELVAVAKFHKS